jgi:hypothetical protein
VTVEQLVFERVGLLRGAWLAAHLGLWIDAAHKLGEFPTTERFAKYVGKSERQAWRYRATIHQAFPGDEFEAVVMAAAAAMRDGQDPLRVELPPELARRSA